VSVALNELRKARLASQVADVSVCGAIAPYNDILGGKLVTLLMGSKEIQNVYKQKYGRKISEIASQLAGKPIYRSSDLMLLTTTSLYGIGSSQYNKIKIPKGFIKGIHHECIWQELRLTQGFGVTHVSDETVTLMRELTRQAYGARRVNSVFGEGSSPRVRQIREALNILNIDNDVIMKHGMARVVYACEFYPGARGDLSGFIPSGKKNPRIPTADALSKSWIKRWVVGRIQNKDILQRLSGLDSAVVSDKFKVRINEYIALHEMFKNTRFVKKIEKKSPLKRAAAL
jgi:hypothetical protein